MNCSGLLLRTTIFFSFLFVFLWCCGNSYSPRYPSFDKWLRFKCIDDCYWFSIGICIFAFLISILIDRPFNRILIKHWMERMVLLNWIVIMCLKKILHKLADRHKIEHYHWRCIRSGQIICNCDYASNSWVNLFANKIPISHSKT